MIFSKLVPISEDSTVHSVQRAQIEFPESNSANDYVGKGVWDIMWDYANNRITAYTTVDGQAVFFEIELICAAPVLLNALFALGYDPDIHQTSVAYFASADGQEEDVMQLPVSTNFLTQIDFFYEE